MKKQNINNEISKDLKKIDKWQENKKKLKATPKTEKVLTLDKDYKSFLKDIKQRLKIAQIRAALAANNELVKFYWQLGNDLLEKQKAYKWGEHFLEQFSHDIRRAFPEMQGFSKRNLEYMRRFALNNGITEGFHRKMKLIQRRAYGFRNFENYRLRVKVLCS